MAKRQAKQGIKHQSKPIKDSAGKVGSDPMAAKAIGGKNDFGAPESNTIERNYTSANTRASDRGAAHPHSGENDDRTTGVGGQASGVGSSSGGDIDTDIVGVGTGGSGVAQSPAGSPPSAADTQGTSGEFASGKPAQGKNSPKAGKIKGDTIDHSGGGIETLGEGRGAGAVSRPARGDLDQLDDAFQSEISEGEASGQDSV